jgi:hypothetical protein
MSRVQQLLQDEPEYCGDEGMSDNDMRVAMQSAVDHSDTAWIAAKHTAAKCHAEIATLVITLPYDQLSPSLLQARIAHDNAQSHLRHVQSRRSIALNGAQSDRHAQPARLSGGAT